MVTEPDHAQSFARVAAGQADAFATDDVLLYGLIATAPNGKDLRVTGDLLSYEPYGLMFRRDDPALAGFGHAHLSLRLPRRDGYASFTPAGSSAACPPAKCWTCR